MSKLEDLLQGVKVEWKFLGDVCKIKTGQTINKKNIENNPGIYPVINSGKEPLGYINEWNTENDPIGIASRGAGVGYISWNSGKYFRGNLNYSVTVKKSENIDDRFLYYLLNKLQNEIFSLCTFEGIPALNASNLNKLSIPIPPIEIQQEIVRILDQLTDTTNNLKRELVNERQIRKKQFEFYREQLFKFEEDVVEWRTLIEVASDFGRGKSKHRPRNDNKLYGGIIPFIQTGDVRNGAKEISNYTQTYNEFGLRQSKLWPKGTVCITIAANIAETSILGFNACFPDSIIGFVPNVKKTNSKYIYYLLSNYKSQLEKLGQGSAQLNINLGTFEHLKFPIPSLVEQERIVHLLDQFDAAHTAIEEEITKEIKLRTQQYEYYREKLLTFPKK